MNKKNKNQNSGFTLVEALVAITILVVSVTGPLALASKGLSYSNYAKDGITAFYLANEAIDMVRNIRDVNAKIGGSRNWLAISSEETLIDKCSQNCYFDVWKNPLELNESWSTSEDEEEYLKICINEGLVRFGYDFEWANVGENDECVEDTKIQETKFRRTVKIDNLSPDLPDPKEIRVTAIVKWETSGGLERNVTITENLFNISI